MASPPSSTAFIFSSSSYSYSSPHFHPLHYLHPIPIPIPIPIGSNTLLPINHQTHYSSCPKPPLPVVVVRRQRIACKGSSSSSSSSEQTSTTSTTSISRAVDSDSDEKRWVPVVPLAALPKGERRVIIQDGETILLLWYKDQVVAIENRSPAQGAFTEGLLNAKLTQDGCIVCPTTDSTYDLQTGAVKDWYPNNPVLRFLTPSLRSLFVYPVKTDDNNIYISMGQEGFGSGVSAEIVFSGRAQPGVTASDVNIEEVRMVVDEDSGGFGFTPKNELINGKAAIIGFLLLLDFEALTGKGLLKGTGFLDFLYAASNAINSF